MSIPTTIDSDGRVVVDGSRIESVTLVVRFGDDTYEFPDEPMTVDRQPIDVLDNLAREDAEDLLGSARYVIVARTDG